MALRLDFGSALVALRRRIGVPIDDHSIDREIHDPDLGNGVAGVQWQLGREIAAKRRIRHLDDQKNVRWSRMMVRISAPWHACQHDVGIGLGPSVELDRILEARPPAIARPTEPAR